MEYKLINWQVIEDGLSSAESKEQLYDIFMASATGKIDSEMCAIKGDNVPDSLKKIPATLGISNEKA
jgi:hypothetical protein